MSRWGLGLALVLGAAVAGAAEDRAPLADPAKAATVVLQQTNAFRVANRLAALAPNRALTDAAQRFAEYMASNDLYGHDADGHQPTDRARERGYEYCIVAENIAYQFSSLGFDTEELAGRFVEGWEQSPGHRRNLLLPQVVDTGIGIARSSRTRRYYAVQMFGRPRNASTHFEIANRSDVDIRYELEGQTYTIPPRVTRTHQGCFGSALKMLWPDGPASPGFQLEDGARYVAQRDEAGQWRLQRKE